MVADLRSIRQHVYLDPCCCLSRHRSARFDRRVRDPRPHQRHAGSHRGARRSYLRLWHAGSDGRAGGTLRRGLWPAADRLDHSQRHFSLSADEREGRVRRPATVDQHHQQRPAAAAPVHRVLTRRFLRGRGRVRNAGRGDGGHPDRSRLLAARGIGVIAHRQHGAGCLRSAGNADHRALGRDGARPARAQRHGRPPASLLLDHRAVLADHGVRRLAQDDRDLAADPGGRCFVRDPAVSRFEFPWAVAGRYRRRARVDGNARALSSGLAAGAPDDGYAGDGARRDGARCHGRCLRTAGGDGSAPARLDALGHTERLRVPVGYAAGARRARRRVDVESPRCRSARAHSEDAARGGLAAHRSRGVQSQSSFGDGHRNSACCNCFGVSARLWPGEVSFGATGGRSTWSDTRSSPFPA